MTENRQRTARAAHRAAVVACLGFALTYGLPPVAARAEHAPPAVAIQNPDAARLPFSPRGASTARSEGAPKGSGSWWLGTAGIALALAAFGAVSVASRRFAPRSLSGPLRVVGRTSLSPRHSVLLLQVGERVLIVGTGPQGAPSLLGELDDPADVERDLPRPSAPKGGDV